MAYFKKTKSKDGKTIRINGRRHKKIERKCLGEDCNQTFDAFSPYERLCGQCKKHPRYNYL